MHPVVVFDVIFALACAAALLFVIKGWKRASDARGNWPLAGLIVFSLFYSLCLAIEWFGLTRALDPFEDIIGALLPMWWAFVFYALMRDIMSRDLRREEDRFREMFEQSNDVIFIRDPETQCFIDMNPAACTFYGYTREEMVGMETSMIVNDFPENIEKRMKKTLDKGKNHFVASHRLASGETRDVEIYAGPMTLQGNTVIYSIIHDVTERKRSEEELRQREAGAKRVARERAIMAKIGRIINASLDIDEVYDRFAEEVRKLIPFDRISINYVNLEDYTVTVAYVFGMDISFRRKDETIPLAGTTAEYVVKKGESLLIRTSELKDLLERFPVISRSIEQGLQSAMSIPLISKDKVIGILHIRSTRPDLYSEKELRLAEQVGYQITSAIVNSRLFADQKRTEEALRLSEERFKDLYDNAPVAYYEYDSEGKITRVNQTFLDMLGYERDEMVGKFIWTFNIEGERRRGEIMQALSGTRPPARELERTLRRKDGSSIPVLIEGRAIHGFDGRIAGFRCTAQDITKRKRAEQELKEKDEFTSSLLESSPIPILVQAKDTSIKYVNPMFEKLTGYALTEIIGKKVPYPWWPEGTRPANIDAVKKNLSKGIRGIQRHLRKKNGDEFSVEIASTPIMDRDIHQYTLTTWIDITDRERSERERRELRVRLQRAEKMEALGTLAGGVAHDLNNILSGIVSYPDLLLMQLEEDSPLRKPVATMQESGKRAAAIVQDLLTLARRGVATTKVQNLNEVISAYLKSPEHEKLLAFHQDVVVETDLKADLLNILGAPVHLSKTVMNLVSNACEAMPDGGKVLISTENRYIDRPIRGYDSFEEGEYVVLSMSDTGVGISPSDRERIFEPFYTKKVMGRSGTGLGMAVVWGTVKDHHGYIDVRSTEGKGTVITLYFPVTKEERIKEPPLSSVEEFKGCGESILVVDDVEGQREIASALLSQLGYNVTAVSSGEEAIEHVKQRAVDLVILDMIMDPGIDGLETYKRIIEIHPNQKAIIASGFAETDRVKAAEGLGVGQYIKKPYSLEQIGIAVQEELAK